jgi:hypothetical protein
MKVTMRLWPGFTPVDAAPVAPPVDLDHQIEEGMIVARSAVQQSTKNGIIVSIMRDGELWSDHAAEEVAQAAIGALARELHETAERLESESQRAAPSEREERRARSRGDRARTAHRRAETRRLSMRSATLRGVADELEVIRRNDVEVARLVARARDDTLRELLQARLIPRASPVVLTAEQQRTAMEGVVADLDLLLLERSGH